jgi:lipid-A-disaccharide synthase-like uncharacterized protein
VPLRWSRGIFLVEAFIAYLLTALFVIFSIFGIIFEIPVHGEANIGQAGAALILVVALVCLFSGWRLIVAFLNNGPDGLSAIPARWWHLSAVGAALCALGLLSFYIPWEKVVVLEYGYELPDPVVKLRCLALGVPLLIPYLHLVMERHLRRNLTIDLSDRGVAASMNQGGS